jgi:hypothetical protein
MGNANSNGPQFRASLSIGPGASARAPRHEPDGAQSVRVRESAYSKEYIGTAAALIEAGLISASQIPGLPGLGKTCATFYRGQIVRRGVRFPRDEHYLSVRRTGTKYIVEVYVSKAEREALWQKERRKRESEREAQRRSCKEADLAFQGDPQNLRDHMRLTLTMLSQLVTVHTDGLRGGREPHFFCQIDPGGARQIVAALEDIREWIEEVEISSDPAHAQARLVSARDDQSFQGFLHAQCLKGDA